MNGSTKKLHIYSDCQMIVAHAFSFDCCIITNTNLKTQLYLKFHISYFFSNVNARMNRTGLAQNRAV